MDSTNEDDHNLSSVSSVSASDTSFITDLEGGKVTLTFTANDLANDLENYKACRNVIDWVYPDLAICSLEKSSIFDDHDTIDGQNEMNFLQIPSLALVIFLQEEEGDKFERARITFQQNPWIFHHSESVNQTMTKCIPANNLDYYRAGVTGPLCGIRQMPCGKQIIRIVRFINYQEWQDNVDLYSLVLSQQPEVTKPDFCLFTTGQTDDYNVQFAIKRAPKGITCTPVNNVKLNFRINHPGHIVPLLPFVCDNVAERHWESKDFDGNIIRFDAQDLFPETRPETPDLSDLVLLEPIESDSDSALSDSTINAYTHSSCDGKRQSKLKPNHLVLDRGTVDGRESIEQYQDEMYIQDSPESSIKLENPWSPISQTDSGQFSHESHQYDQSAVLSSPENNHMRKRLTTSGSNCSSDLGFQDRYSSSESRWEDQDQDNSDFRDQRRTYDYRSDNCNHKLDVRVYRNGAKSHSDFALSGSDGSASTCTYDETEVGSYQNDFDQRQKDYNCYRQGPRNEQLNKYNDHHMNPKPTQGRTSNAMHPAHNGSHSHESQDHLWHRKFSNSETHLETPQRYAFRKLKKYRESQSSTENLDLFNVSSYKTSKESSRSHRKHQKTKSFPDNLKSVSELESVPGSDTEYEHAYESIERDLEIINNALYGKSSHSSRNEPTTKHKFRSKESLQVTHSVENPVHHQKDIPYIQGFYV